MASKPLPAAEADVATSATPASPPTSSVVADPDSAWPQDAVEVGRVLDAFGVKGWFKVQAYASDPQALLSSRRWFTKPPEDIKPGLRAPIAALPATLTIQAVRYHGEGLVAQALGVSDRSAAEALGGARLFVSRSAFPPAAPDENYWVDLIGLDVVNRQGEALGSVVGLIDTGPHSVLRILPVGMTAPVKPDQERLVPFVAQFVDAVDLPRRLITVDWGLDY